MPSKIFSIRPAKFLMTFLSVVKFQDNSLPGCPLPCCTGNDIFLLIFCHLPTFVLQKLAPWMPPGWMPGAVAPSAPPLHATARYLYSAHSCPLLLGGATDYSINTVSESIRRSANLEGRGKDLRKVPTRRLEWD